MKQKQLWGSIIGAVLVLGAGLVGVASAQQPPESALTIISATDNQVVLELTVPDYTVETIVVADQPYQRLTIPGTTLIGSPGDPQVPVQGTMVGLPTLSNVSVTVVDADFETLSGYRLYPAPATRVTGDAINSVPPDFTQNVFTLNQNRYRTDAFFPEAPVAIGGTGLIRDQAVAQVQFYPLQYNPVTSEVRLYRRLRVRVTWTTPSARATSVARPESAAFDRVLQKTLLNYSSLPHRAVAPRAILPSVPRRQSATAGTPLLKIGVTEDGLYELTPTDLTSAGFNLTGIDFSTIKLTNRGAEIPIYAVDGNSNNVFDGNDVILFYGTAITDIYTVKNVYWLQAGGGGGQRMAIRNGSLAGGDTVPTQFPVTHHAEQDTVYWFMPGADNQEDHWFWDDRISPATSGLPTYRDYSLPLANISTTATTATLRVRQKGYTALGHRTKLYLNGTLLDDQSWSGQSVFDQVVDFSHNLLAENNVVRVEAADSGDALPHQMLVNWLELDYWDTYVAENDALVFGAPQAGTFQFEVTGFSDAAVQVFDVTTPTNVSVISDTTVVAVGANYTVQFRDSVPANVRYLALTPAQRKKPASIELDVPSSWKDPANGADYILITYKDFYTSALTLSNFRSSQGLRVATVKIEDIYDEFNAGIANPAAIRDFLSYAYHSWQSPAPTYVLLVSGATIDYRNLKNLGRVNYVPTHLTVTDLLGETPSDNWFVAVSGDDILPDMFIGRLTAQSSADVDEMVSKIIAYEQTPPDSSWNTNVLLVADDGNPPADNDPTFENLSEALITHLPPYFTPNKVYLLSDNPPAPKTDIINYIDSGSLLVNYSGHGNRDFWAQEKIFTVADVPGLNNTNKYPVVTVANCLNGFFVGSSKSMAEAFLESSNSGAVGVWADSSLSYPSGHLLLLSSFYDTFFKEYQYALGAATTAAKLNAYAQSTFWGELVETFVLFGDPATQLGVQIDYPTVQNTSPAAGATGVLRDEPLTITFSKPMSLTTVALSGAGTTGLTYTPAWNVDYTQVTFAHDTFDYGQTLTFTISGKDTLGNPLGPGTVPATWSFATVPAVGLNAVQLSGPTTGFTQTMYSFAAIAGPITATLPVTYTWQATGQLPVTHANGGLGDVMTFTWSITGPQAITVTAANRANVVSDTHVITIGSQLSSPPAARPVESVATSGPLTDSVNSSVALVATVSPLSATLPITFVWQATSQLPVTHTNSGLNDVATFVWDAPGTHVVTVTAQNSANMASATHTVHIEEQSASVHPLDGVTISGARVGTLQTVYQFTAAVSPITATLPVTYVWQTAGQAPQTHLGGSPGDVMTFTWNITGVQTITVTATNIGGTVSSTHLITVTDGQAPAPNLTAIFLPLILR